MTTKRLSIKGFALRVAELGGDMEAAVMAGLRKSAVRLSDLVVHEIDNADPFAAVDRGLLRNSVRVRPTARGITTAVEAPHAPMIEGGTRPFFPPIEPLIEWVRRKGFASDEGEVRRIAYAVQQKIGKEGIKPRFFMKKAFAKFRQEKGIAPFVAEELAKLARTKKAPAGRKRKTKK